MISSGWKLDFTWISGSENHNWMQKYFSLDPESLPIAPGFADYRTEGEVPVVIHRKNKGPHLLDIRFTISHVF